MGNKKTSEANNVGQGFSGISSIGKASPHQGENSNLILGPGHFSPYWYFIIQLLQTFLKLGILVTYSIISSDVPIVHF